MRLQIDIIEKKAVIARRLKNNFIGIGRKFYGNAQTKDRAVRLGLEAQKDYDALKITIENSKLKDESITKLKEKSLVELIQIAANLDLIIGTLGDCLDILSPSIDNLEEEYTNKKLSIGKELTIKKRLSLKSWLILRSISIVKMEYHQSLSLLDKLYSHHLFNLKLA